MPQAARRRRGRGSLVHWRADFDWVSLRITTDAVALHAAHLWRMTATDYRTALGKGESTPLAGPPVASPWDPAPTLVVEESGSAVMEERLLSVLLSDVTGA
ncbi:DUF2399 domain-containing protein [Streptomyces sp. JW3]|uniref:DUF2399 domain-containing protein n=1 Tax=Streptomyces sp. JW3 TaxID=3456955 RepID=UPI003FA47292